MQKGFAQILVIGIVVALVAVGIGSYQRVSKQPVGNEGWEMGGGGDGPQAVKEQIKQELWS